MGSLRPIQRKSPGDAGRPDGGELVAEVSAGGATSVEVEGAVDDHRAIVCGESADRRRVPEVPPTVGPRGHRPAPASRALDRQRRGRPRRLVRGRRPHRHRPRAGVAAWGSGSPPSTVARVVSSPLQRCLRDGRPARCPTTPWSTDDRLGECHYGGWTGRSLAEPPRTRCGASSRTTRRRRPSPRTTSTRGVAGRDGGPGRRPAIRALDAEVEAEHGADAVWVAVSHGDPIKAVVAEAVGAGIAGLQRVRVDPGSITAIHLTERPRWCSSRATPSSATSAPLVARPRHAPAGDSEVGGGAG